MKKQILAASVVFLVFFAFPASADAAQMYTAESEHYRILSDVSQDFSQAMASRMEAYFRFFNSYFRFREGSLKAALTVRIFGNKEAFDTYLTRLIPQSRDSYVYIQDRDPAKSELVVYQTDSGFSEQMLVHHAFIQFLKSHVANPPLWLLSGFSLYFEKSEYRSGEDAVAFRTNTAWIKPLKELVRVETLGNGHGKLIPVDALFTATADEVAGFGDSFHPQAWGWISFLIEGREKGYERILWDAIAALDSDAQLEQNSYIALDETIPWYDEDMLKYDFMRYAESQMTFSELVTQGIESYKRSEYFKSWSYFERAISLQSDSPVPYYYLGLISYGDENYTDAEYYYNTSLNAGGERALCLYALGLNAMAAKRYGEAREYLIQAATADPSRYDTKVQELLQKLEEL